jgi:integrase
MEDWEKRLNNYLEKLDESVEKTNANLIKEFCNVYKSLPTEPGARRILASAMRLKTISLILKKPLDSLTEIDLQKLNLAMRERQYKSSQDYRKNLKRFLKLKDKKRYYDLIESDFLKAPSKGGHYERTVDPETFWSQKEIEAYTQESTKYSLRQTAWAGLWLSTGCRPHELFGLEKRDIKFEDNKNLVIRIRQGKTGFRSIILQNQEANGVWYYIQPYLETLNETDKLFPISYNMQKRIHLKICKRANISTNKDLRFYMARRMNLTKFYNTYGLAKAAALAGHVPGAKSMRQYVALTESQLKDEPMTTLSQKQCSNPACCATNEAHETNCTKCGSPLNKQKFAQIIQNNIDELIETKMALVKKQLELKIVNSLS